jgi:hypothetical protein
MKKRPGSFPRRLSPIEKERLESVRPLIDAAAKALLDNNLERANELMKDVVRGMKAKTN